MLRIVLPLIVISIINHYCQAQVVYEVGPGLQFESLQNAYDSIPQSISSPYEIHLMPGYSTAYDTLPITFRPKYGASSTNTITVLPQAPGITLFPDSVPYGEAMVFDSCSYVIIDGRVGGVGDTANMRITNIYGVYHTIVLKSASYNQIKYCDISSTAYLLQHKSAIFLGGSGSSHNLFEKNLIHGNGQQVPDSLFHATGNYNNYNTLKGNYFFGCDTVAVHIDGPSSNAGWIIQDNHVFQGDQSGGFDFVIHEGTSLQVDSNMVTGNYMGGSGPYSTGEPFAGGLFYEGHAIVENNVLANWKIEKETMSGTIINTIRDANENTFRNMHFDHGVFKFIRASSDARENVFTDLGFTGSQIIEYVHAYSVENNLIGDTLSTDAIHIQMNGYQAGHYFLLGNNVQNNIIAGIKAEKGALDTISGGGVPNPAYPLHLKFVRGVKQDGNTIGSLTTQNSISVSDSINAYVSGGYTWNSNGHYRISNSTISNVNIGKSYDNSGSGSAFVGFSADTLHNNTLKNIICHGSVIGLESEKVVTGNLLDSLVSVNNSLTGIIGNTVVGNSLYNLHAENAIEGISVDFGSNNFSAPPGRVVGNVLSDLYGSSFFNYGINTENGVSEVTDNTVSNFHCGGVVAYGIRTEDFGYIQNNLIENFYTSSAESNGCFGIEANGNGAIRDNTVRNLFCLSNNTGISNYGGQDSIYRNLITNLIGNRNQGIHASGGNQTILDNHIENLYGIPIEEDSLGGIISGIAGGRLVRNNFVNGLLHENSKARVIGLGEPDIAINNLVSLGNDQYGNPSVNKAELTGINQFDLGEIYFNTVFLSSDNLPDSAYSTCLRRFDTNSWGDTLTAFGNIFFNNCSSDSAHHGTHYTYFSYHNTLQVLDYNLHYAPGNGGILAMAGSGILASPLHSLSDMQAAMVGQHQHSIIADPQFVNPSSSIADLDLSLNVSSSAYGAGVSLPSVANDYYYYPRSSHPTLGAIENVHAPCSKLLSVTSCGPYTSPSLAHVWSQNGTYLDTLTNQSGCDSIYIINLTVVNGSSSSISVAECFSFQSPSGHIWTESGSYIDTIQNVLGCDSLIQIDLEIRDVDTSITVDGSSLISNQSGASYQWLDCNQNLIPITGETGAAIDPLFNGYYAVEVTANGCTDTSLCAVIGNVGIEHVDSNQFDIYPNPTTGLITIGLPSNPKDFTLNLFDPVGRLVDSRAVMFKQLFPYQIPNSNGIYLVQLVFSDGNVLNNKVIKE